MTPAGGNEEGAPAPPQPPPILARPQHPTSPGLPGPPHQDLSERHPGTELRASAKTRHLEPHLDRSFGEKQYVFYGKKRGDVMEWNTINFVTFLRLKGRCVKDLFGPLAASGE